MCCKEHAKRVWDRFVAILNVDTFGEKAILTECKKIKVLYGSVDYHHKIFEKACKEIDDEFKTECDWR